LLSFEILVYLIKAFKDGVQLSDFTDFWTKLTTDVEFKNKIEAGYKGVKAIPEEAKDADAGEIIELCTVPVQYTPEIIKIFKPELVEEKKEEIPAETTEAK
jgi:hypothetical protein